MSISLQCKNNFELLKNSSLCGGPCGSGFSVNKLDDKFCVKQQCPEFTQVDSVDNSICVKLEGTTPAGKYEKDPDPLVECDSDYALIDGFCYKYCPVSPHYYQENVFYCSKIKIQRETSPSYCPLFYSFNGADCSFSLLSLIPLLLIFLIIVYIFSSKSSPINNRNSNFVYKVSSR